MSEEKRQSFIFYRSFYESFENLSEKQVAKIFKAICKFSFDGEIETNLTGIEKALFTLILPQLQANTKKFENGKKGAEFGSLGGRPKKNNQENKNPLGVIDENPKKTPNVNVNVNDNVNVNVNAKNNPNNDDIKLIAECYENHIGMISSSVMTKFENYLNDGILAEVIVKAIESASQNNARKFSYINAILQNCINNQILTIRQWNIKEREREERKAGKAKTQEKTFLDMVDDYD